MEEGKIYSQCEDDILIVTVYDKKFGEKSRPYSSQDENPDGYLSFILLYVFKTYDSKL